MAHPKILPWVLLLKRECGASDTVRWRYAVCGMGCTELFGLSYQNKIFGDDLPPDAVAKRQAEFDRVCGGSGPLFSETELPVAGKSYVRVFRGVFPFASDGPAVDRLMVIIADTRLQVR